MGPLQTFYLMAPGTSDCQRVLRDFTGKAMDLPVALLPVVVVEADSSSASSETSTGAPVLLDDAGRALALLPLSAALLSSADRDRTEAQSPFAPDAYAPEPDPGFILPTSIEISFA